jgi:formylglycine-generating enzyme required for sulfatase activity
MTPHDARALLELPADATPDQVEQRFLELRKRLEEKIAGALTPTLRTRYEKSLAEITRAYETLVLAADGAELPVLTQTNEESQIGAGVAAERQSRKQIPAWRRRLGLAVLTAIALLAGSSWGWRTWRTHQLDELNKQATVAQEAGDWETALRSRRVACEQQPSDATHRAYSQAQTAWLASMKERFEKETPVALYATLRAGAFPASSELEPVRRKQLEEFVQAGHARIKAHVESELARAQKLANEERKFAEAEVLIDQLTPLAAVHESFATEADKVRAGAAEEALDAVQTQLHKTRDYAVAKAAIDALEKRPGLPREKFLEARIHVRLSEFMDAIERLAAQAREGSFAEALAGRDRVEKIGREMEALEGYAAFAKALGQSADDGSEFSVSEIMESVRKGIGMLMAVQTVSELATALKARDAAQAQAVIDGYAALARRPFTVTGNALVGAGTVDGFLGEIRALGLDGDDAMDARVAPSELVLVEAKLGDFNSDEAKPAALGHLAKQYRGWAEKLLAAERPGLALYVLKRGMWLAVLNEPEIVEKTRQAFAQRYPLAIHLPETEVLREDGPVLVEPARKAVREALQSAGNEWISLVEQVPSEEALMDDRNGVFVVRTAVSGITTERDRVSTRSSVRYQSGTENRANPAYDQAVRAIGAAEEAHREALEAKTQAQSQVDSATDKTIQAIAAIGLVAATSDAGKAERALADAKARLASTSRYLQGAVYADEPYEVTNRRVNHAAVFGVTLEQGARGEDASDLASWSANLRYAALEVSGDARRGVPVQKAVFLDAGAVGRRLSEDLAGKIAGQRELMLNQLAAAVLVKRKKLAIERGQGSDATADFECGAALLWEKAGVSVDYAALEKTAAEALSLPAVLQFPEAFGYGQPMRIGAQVENSLGMRFSPLPGASVWMSIRETRVQDFRAFVEATKHTAAKGMFSLTAEGWKQLPGASWTAPGFEQTAEHPVCGVSWLDATAFCAWLTKAERETGRLAPNQRYRLPTVAEWQQAFATTVETGDAGSAKKASDKKGGHVWGADWPPPPGAGNFAGADAVDGTWPAGWATLTNWRDGFARTAPVGSFSANRFGFYDLDGNVAEWSADSGGNTQERVICGGSFISSSPETLRVAAQLAVGPGYSGCNIGFRVVLVTE